MEGLYIYKEVLVPYQCRVLPALLRQHSSWCFCIYSGICGPYLAAVPQHDTRVTVGDDVIELIRTETGDVSNTKLVVIVWQRRERAVVMGRSYPKSSVCNSYLIQTAIKNYWSSLEYVLQDVMR